MTERPFAVGISKAPDDPEEKKEWVNSMMRIQIAMWLPCTCEECGYTYKNVDDFLRCNPHRGHTEKMSFVCASCYPTYKDKHPLLESNTKDRKSLP